MGNSITATTPQVYDVLGPGWHIVQKEQDVNIWKNEQTGEEIEEHTI